LIILIHGWESNAGGMYGFIDELLERKNGLSVLTYLLMRLIRRLKQISKNVKMLLHNLPEYDNLSIIAHSFGSGISTYALSELEIKVDKLIF